MRRPNVIQEKLQSIVHYVEDLRNALKPEVFQQATLYQRGAISALKWVLGQQEEI